MGGVNEEAVTVQTNDSIDDRMERSIAQREALARNYNEYDGLYHVNGKAYDPKDGFHEVGGVNFVQKSWTPGYEGTWTNDQHLDWFQKDAAAQHAGTMGWADEKEAARVAGVSGQADSDAWRAKGLKTKWESA